MKYDLSVHSTEPRMVLSLKVGGSVEIGPITIQVTERHGNSVRIAIMAPREFEIHRRPNLDKPPE